MARATWGVKPEVPKTIYLYGTERIILYGSEVWFSRKIRILDKLNSIQAIPLRSLTKCYKTTSHVALQILSGIKPIDLKIIDEIIVHHIKNCLPIDHLVDGEWNYKLEIKPSLTHPAQCVLIPWSTSLPTCTDWEVYTDGSKIVTNEGERAGCGIIIKYNNHTIYSTSFRLENYNNVFMAELAAIYQAMLWMNHYQILNYHLYTDSRSSLQAFNSLDTELGVVQNIKDLWHPGISFSWVKAHVGLPGNEEADTMAKHGTNLDEVNLHFDYSVHQLKTLVRRYTYGLWQQRWDSASKGRQTYKFFPTVSLKRLKHNFYLNQIYTGHGVFAVHQQRIFGANAECQFCGGLQDINHLIVHCHKFDDIRGTSFNRYSSQVEWMKDEHCRQIAIYIVKSTLEDVLD